MRKLGEQWVEEFDGKMHMVKAAEAINKGHVCNGCAFNNGTCDYKGDECPVPKDCYIKDLGILNDDGFLPEERSGQYPDISYDADMGIYEARLHATLIDPPMAAVLVRVQASSMDKLRDAWNRRAQ